MKKSGTYLLAGIIALLQHMVLCAQNVDMALKRFASAYPSEKIYIQYDNDYYVTGETIWFKAYLFRDGFPDDLSYNFYLQLTDSKGKIIVTQQYPVKGATVAGSISLPDSLEQGYYAVRAMTPARLNGDQDFLYNKLVFIFNPVSGTMPTLSSSPALPLSIRFFPESGNLVEGILTAVAFKATDAHGYPVDIRGIIKTDDTLTVASFKSLHDGIGKFQFRPLPRKKYTAAIDFNGQTNYYPLPETQLSGINLKVENEKGGKAFTISRSKTNKEAYAEVRILAQMNNRVYFDQEVSFDKFYLVKGHLVTDSMPSGILHFTVFGKDGIPLVERVSFVDNREYETKGEIAIVKKGIGKREENNIEVSFPEAVQRSFSVSVTDFSFPGPGDKDDIVSSLLLTGDLRGVIYNPSWYFHQPADTAAEALDNLLLTHGWSRFNWKKIMDGGFPEKKYADIYLMNMSGTVYDEKNKNPAMGGALDILLSTEDSSLLAYTIPVNQTGRFIIDSLNFMGEARTYYTYKDEKGKEKPVTLKIDDNRFMPGIPELALPFPQTPFDPYLVNVVNRNGRSIRNRYAFLKVNNPGDKLLENVTVKTKLKRPVDIVNEKYTSEVFRTGGRVVIDNINNPPVDKSINGLDYIKNRITTVDLQRGTFVNKKNFSLENHKDRKGPGDTETRFWEVGLFINEMPVDLIQLKALRADQIATVKFFEAGFIGAAGAYPGGAIAVYLTDGVAVSNQVKNAKYTPYEGYTVTREFYSPDYATAGSSIPQEDNRSTLYWNPELYTGSQPGAVQLKFFNNDFSKKLKIVIEGFDAKGKLIHIEKIIGE